MRAFYHRIRGHPLPLDDYLLAAFVAPIALLFLFGVIIQGFEMLGQDAPETAPGAGVGQVVALRYLLGLLAFMAALVLPQGEGRLFSAERGH